MKQPFERIVDHHAAMVLRVCRAVLGPHSDADDAWSETFLAAMNAWPELPDDANVEACFGVRGHDVLLCAAGDDTDVHRYSAFVVG